MAVCRSRRASISRPFGRVWRARRPRRSRPSSAPARSPCSSARVLPAPSEAPGGHGRGARRLRTAPLRARGHARGEPAIRRSARYRHPHPRPRRICRRPRARRPASPPGPDEVRRHRPADAGPPGTQEGTQVEQPGRPPGQRGRRRRDGHLAPYEHRAPLPPVERPGIGLGCGQQTCGAPVGRIRLPVRTAAPDRLVDRRRDRVPGRQSSLAAPGTPMHRPGRRRGRGTEPEVCASIRWVTDELLTGVPSAGFEPDGSGPPWR